MTSVNRTRKRQVKILYVLARDGPLNPYKMWAKLVKEDLASQPTIRADLEEMCEKGDVETVETDQKARGGKPSNYYELSYEGLAIVVRHYDLLGDKVEDAGQFASYIAKKYHDLLPPIFELWPEFGREKVDRLAWKALQFACQFLTDEGRDGTYYWFFHSIINHLVLANPDHDVWHQAVGRSQAIAQALLVQCLTEVVEHTERANHVLLSLPHQMPLSDRESTAMKALKNALRRLQRSLEEYKDSSEA